MKTRIVIIEGHPMFSEALVRAIDAGISGVEIRIATCLKHAAELSMTHGPFTLGLLDMRAPDAMNLEALTSFVSEFPLLPVGVVSTVPSSRFVEECRNRGALGVITKSADGDVIRSAVRLLLAGRPTRPADYMPSFETSSAVESVNLATRVRSLSSQQTRILMMVCQGLLNKDIAIRSGLKEATIKSHVTGILRRLRVKSRTEAVVQLLHCDLEFWQPAASRDISVFRAISLGQRFDTGDAMKPRSRAPQRNDLRGHRGQ